MSHHTSAGTSTSNGGFLPSELKPVPLVIILLLLLGGLSAYDDALVPVTMVSASSITGQILGTRVAEATDSNMFLTHNIRQKANIHHGIHRIFQHDHECKLPELSESSTKNDIDENHMFHHQEYRYAVVRSMASVFNRQYMAPWDFSGTDAKQGYDQAPKVCAHTVFPSQYPNDCSTLIRLGILSKKRTARPFPLTRYQKLPSLATNTDCKYRHDETLAKESCQRSTRTIQSIVSLRAGATKETTQAVRGTPSSIWSDLVASEAFRRLIVTALVTLCFEGAIGHILEYLKIRLQTAVNDDTALTYGKVIHDIVQAKGIGGLWDGFVPWGIIQAVSKGAVFGWAHSAARNLLVPLADRGVISLGLAYTLAGGIGGGFQGLVLSPTLLLKTRVMTNPVFRTNLSLAQTTWLSLRIGLEVVRSEGVSALMKGSTIFATKRVFDWATRYYFADLFEALFLRIKNGQRLTVTQKSLASFLGGVASTAITLPLDVLVAKIQDAKQAGVAVSPWQLFLEEQQTKGWSGLRQSYMRGFEARLIHVCLTTVVVKTGTPIAYEAMFGSGRQE